VLTWIKRDYPPFYNRAASAERQTLKRISRSWRLSGDRACPGTARGNLGGLLPAGGRATTGPVAPSRRGASPSRRKEIGLADISRRAKTILKSLTDPPLNDELWSLEESVKQDFQCLPQIFDCGEDIEEDRLEDRRQSLIRVFKKIRQTNSVLEKIPPRKKNAFARGRLVVKIIQLIGQLNIWPARLELIIGHMRERFESFCELAESGDELESSLRRIKDRQRRAELQKRLAEVKKLLNKNRDDSG
jgi:hypothetical protein